MNQKSYEYYSNLLEPIKNVILNIEKEKRKTILEISGYPHYEDVISNFYKFYFDKEEEHKFGELFLRTLLKMIHEISGKHLIFDEYEVFREVETNNNNRIDILIEQTDKEKAIIIENKVYHSLVNDLDDYLSSSDANSKNKIGIVLSLRPVKIEVENFINITHSQYLTDVIKNLGFSFRNSDDRHLLLLKDFVENILELSNKTKRMDESLKFYFDHKDKIHEFSELKERARKYSLDAVREASLILGYELQNSNPKNYRCLIISKRPALRYWVYIVQEKESHFLSIYLDLYARTKEKAEDLIKNLNLEKIALKHEITLDSWAEERGGISIAEKQYSLNTKDFLNLKDYIVNIIKKDWNEFTEEVRKEIKKS